MAYTIVKSDGTTLTTIANGTINTSSTSVALPGRNYAGYGEYLDTNFVHMLENFADNTVPANPLRGQLWYNTTTSTMYICPTDGETNAANWYAITTASSAGNTTLGNLTVTGNILANNITATNNLDANSISCNYLTVNVNANMANANFSGTANATVLKTNNITTGSQSTTGVLTGVWTANGAGTPAGGPSGTSFYVTGGNLVISNTSSRGIVADFFYYGNGSPISFGGSYSNSNVAAYLPTYTGTVGATSATLRGATVTTGAAGTAGTLTGNFSLSAGSQLQANTVLDGAQPNITSVGTLSSLNVSANIIAGNVFANSGVIKAAYLNGDGSNITNISVAAGTSIVNGTSNVVVDASGNVRTGVAGTGNVLVVASGGANITGYANISTNAFIGGSANVTSNVNAGNLNGILANLGTSNVRILSATGNVVTTVGGTSTLTVTSLGANIGGYANITGNANAGNIGVTTLIATNANVGTIQNGNSNVRIAANGNVSISATGQSNIVQVQGSAGGNTVGISGNLTTTGFVTVGAIRLPNTDGTASQVLTTYGNGITYWATGGGGGVQSIIANGTSNVSIPAADSSIIANVGGATKLTISSSQAIFGVNITTGTNSATAGNLIVSTAANIPLIQNGSSNIAIASSGNVNISVAGTSNVMVVKTTGGAGVEIAGTLNTGTGNANVGNIGATIGVFSGNINVNGNVVANQNVIAYASSDSRLKDNIVVIENALDKIKKISGVMFDWKEGHAPDRIHDTGVIAQEVEAVLPEVVVTRQDGFKAVRYEKIIGLVIQAIKELANEVEELKKR